jgi:hypothetical protein
MSCHQASLDPFELLAVKTARKEDALEGELIELTAVQEVDVQSCGI